MKIGHKLSIQLNNMDKSAFNYLREGMQILGDFIPEEKRTEACEMLECYENRESDDGLSFDEWKKYYFYKDVLSDRKEE